jgi:hypothetical protein
LGIQAHETNLSSSVLIEQEEGKWLLQIRGSLTAFEYEIENQYGDSAYTTPKEFKTLVINYLHDNVSILLNNSQFIGLQNGMVKLGHETSVTYQLTSPLDSIENLTFHNGSFRNIPRNNNLVFILKDGFSKDQFILNNENNQTIKLQTKGNQFVLVKPRKKSSFQFAWGIIAVLISITTFGVFILYRRRTKTISAH